MRKVFVFLALSLLFAQPVIAEDCWEAREFDGIGYCKFLYVQDCGIGDYTDYFDCQSAIGDSTPEERNFVQTIYEENFNFEIPFLDKLYKLTNEELVCFTLIIALLYWIMDNARRNK